MTVPATQGHRLEDLAALALQSLRNGDYRQASYAFASAAEILPPNSRLRDAIHRALVTLSFHVNAGSMPPPQLISRCIDLANRLATEDTAIPVTPFAASGQSSPRAGMKKLGPIAVILGFLAKFKSLAFLLTQGKALLLGLANIKAIFSILAFVGIYWAMFGWWFAIGFAGSIFLHEMGHYVTVRRYGFAADAPVFIPGIAAYVRWRGENVDPAVRARIALAGPLFGFAAAICCYFIYAASGQGVWLAIAHTGVFLNLLNLIPVFIFDGSSAFHPLSRGERLAIVVLALALWFLLGETIFLFVALGAGFRVFRKDYPSEGSPAIAYYFAALLIGLGFFDWWMLHQANTLFSGAASVPRSLIH